MQLLTFPASPLKWVAPEERREHFDLSVRKESKKKRSHTAAAAANATLLPFINRDMSGLEEEKHAAL